MFQDPFIRSFLRPGQQAPPQHGTSEEEEDTARVLELYDQTIGEAIDATQSKIPSNQRSQTERSARQSGRKTMTKRRQTTHREKGFVLRQHINDQQIPNYDAIMDQHAKFVENAQFAEHVNLTRPLTPEHQHILDSRIKLKEDADLAVMALTGVVP